MILFKQGLEIAIVLSLILFFLGCKDDDTGLDAGTDTETNLDGGTDTETTTDTESDSCGYPTEDPVFTCHYENPFSHENECKAYYGDWSEDDTSADCATVFTGVTSEFGTEPCAMDTIMGSCTVEVSQTQTAITWYYGGDRNVSAEMCDTYLEGVWKDAECAPQQDAGVCEHLEEALGSMVSDDEITVAPECVDDTCVETLAEAGEWIEFQAKTTSPSSGFIFYPGAIADPRMYAPVVKTIAQEGMFVALVPMPGNTATSGYALAGDIIAAKTDISKWYLGGHSMGGLGAITYVMENNAALDGLVLWASYGTAEQDVHDVAIPTTSIYGSVDGQATPTKIENGKPFIPADTVYVEIPGGNHAQFGHMCQADADNDPLISREDQHGMAALATLHFIRTLEAGSAPDPHPGFAPAADKALEWCPEAQRIVVNPADGDLPLSSIESTQYESPVALGGSSAAIDVGQQKLSAPSYLRYSGNGSLLTAPSIQIGEVWCKMKTQEPVVSAFSLTGYGDEGSCATINEAAVAWALATVSQDERDAYANSGKTIEYLADEDFSMGLDWLSGGEISFATSQATPGLHQLRSPRMYVADDQSVPEEKRQVIYCKLWSPARALRWILEQK